MRSVKLILHLALMATFVVTAAACGSDGGGGQSSATVTATPTPEPTPEPGHMHVILGSDQAGGGNLATDFDFSTAVKVFFSQCFGGTGADCQGGMSLYSGEVGFEPLAEDEATDTFFPLAAGTALSLEITAIDEAVQLKFGDAVLSQAGDSVELGSVPGFHTEAEGQVVVPGVQTGGEYQVSFRIVDDGGQYGDSPDYTLSLTPSEGSPPPPDAN
jgi:hypothetical protein